MIDGSSGPGLVRRIRRVAGLSQRELASLLDASQSRVARWETGRTSPSLADLERMAARAGLRLVLVDDDGASVEPMRLDGARDRGGRRFPAHVDLHATEWWTPPGSHLTVEGLTARLESQRRGQPRIGYSRGIWQRLERALYGVPPDHPSREELVHRLAAGRGGGSSTCSVDPDLAVGTTR
jgi:transcriptional regulator with XRE-family HTH domain